MTSLSIPPGLEMRILQDSDREALLPVLDRDPVGCLYLRSLIHEFGISPTQELEHGTFYASSRGGEVGAVLFLGNSRNITTAGRPADLAPLLEHALGRDGARLFVGPAEHSGVVRRALLRSAASPLLDRAQIYYVLTPRTLVPLDELPIRLARPHELQAIVHAQAAMTEEDLEIPRGQIDTVRLRGMSRRRIREGKVWVIMEGSRLIFKTEEVARVPEGILVGGVYTRSDHRGKGYAGRAIASWARRLFEEGLELLALHVNAGNTPAIRAYERVGFRPYAELRLILTY
jgi:ribosomal protein S18 acetylase RimI-like enzyme